MSDKVLLFPAHSKMTADEALAYAAKENYTDVLIIAYADDKDGLVIRSSHMSRRDALWMIEFAKLHVMDRE